jgi:predicted ATPase
MLTELRIRNFKSIRDVELTLGRINVFIGENGCGKSNLLEAVALTGAAVGGKLDNEFLASRGIRLTEPQHMRSAFCPDETKVYLGFTFNSETAAFQLTHAADDPYSGWRNTRSLDDVSNDLTTLFRAQGNIDVTLPDDISSMPIASPDDIGKLMARYIEQLQAKAHRLRPLVEYVIYSPENTYLRTFEVEGQIQPLGIRGEGLFKLLKHLSADGQRLAAIVENLRLIDWFSDLRIPTDLAPYERHLEIRDRYFDEQEATSYFDQRSANEGFLFLLFFFTLFVSPSTPKLFAIDNIDASLNPKLCTELMRRLVLLARAHDKQVLITTHNPAVLDGLNLHDADQRLIAVYRNSKGHTRTRPISAPTPLAGEPPVKLSEAFSRGLLGGLPQNF